MINLLDTEIMPINLIHNGAKDFLLLTVFSSKEEAFKNMSDHSLYATFFKFLCSFCISFAHIYNASCST